MIFSATNPDCLESVMAGDAGDVGPEFWLEFLANAFLAFFGAKDHVNTHARVGMRHGPSLRDLIGHPPPTHR